MQLHEWLARVESARTLPAVAERGIARRTHANDAGRAAFANALDARIAAQERAAATAEPAARGDETAASDPADETGAASSAGGARRVEISRYVVKRGDTLWGLGVRTFGVDPGQLARDNGIEDPDCIRPGQVLVIRKAVDAGSRRVVASWYGPGFDRRPMANGDPYDRHAATIAHKTLPLGTEVELSNPATGATVRATVTDRGPYVGGRDVDLSYSLARRLGVYEPGVAELVMRVRG